MGKLDVENEKQKQELELVQRHLPVLYMDQNEPFLPLYIGYSIFEKAKISASTGRMIDPASKKAAVCIEYAYYYDYDIQHLYDLEHLWIYLDGQEKVCGCECSFHGRYLNAMLPGTVLLHGENKVHMYVQPGKHAFMPEPELFHLFIDFWDCCGALAGKDGILTPDVIPGMPAHSEEDDRKMEAFIRKRFSFVPAEAYVEWENRAELMEWDELKSIIPGRVREKMEEAAR